ncbi:MAG: trypsin-like peptidase domain-containing protein [Lysobacterales bacterium]
MQARGLPNCGLKLRRVVGAIALCLGASAFAGDANEYGIRYEFKPMPEGVTRVASWREFDASLSARQTKFTYATPDAAFVKVFFDYVDLPDGWVLEVANPDGSESYRYGGKQPADRTVDADMGHNGSTSFAAMSIEGGKAVVRLIAPSPSGVPQLTGARPAQPVVKISHVLEGFPEDLKVPLADAGLLESGPTPQSICGSDQKRPVLCYTGTKPLRAKAVARLLIGGGGSCTAWRVGSGNRFMTNNHCFSTSSAVAASEVQFNYQTTTCTGSTTAPVTKVAGSSLLRTSSTLDYSLFTVASTASLSTFGFLSLDVRIPTTGETIYIPQHPGGRRKELAIDSTSDSGGKCKIQTANTGVNSTYLCDTEPGSSGSPVLATASDKVINLHHLGGCDNAGVRVSRIWPEIASFFNNVVP